MLPGFGGMGLSPRLGCGFLRARRPLQDGACVGDQAEPWARCPISTLRLQRCSLCCLHAVRLKGGGRHPASK